jgi:mxaJ protein
MSSACNRLIVPLIVGAASLALVFLVAGGVGRPLLAASSPPLRVCADPNNLPFSNDRGEGFENKLAELVASDLGRRLEYFWAPQRRGFFRTTLRAGKCDLVISVPAQLERALTTKPYYRSTYVFVSRRDRQLDVHSFDDPRLKHLLIGIQITGEDYENPPPAHALAARQLAANVRGYTVYGDYSKPSPQRTLIDAVANGTVDVAVAWGPLAGYFAAREPMPLDVRPVSPASDGPGVPFTFDISMGVRRGDTALRERIDAVLVRRHADVQRILKRFGVPIVDATHTTRRYAG